MYVLYFALNILLINYYISELKSFFLIDVLAELLYFYYCKACLFTVPWLIIKTGFLYYSLLKLAASLYLSIFFFLILKHLILSFSMLLKFENYQIRPTITNLNDVFLQFYDIIELKTFLFLYSIFSRKNLKDYILTTLLVLVVIASKIWVFIIVIHLLFVSFYKNLSLLNVLENLLKRVDGKKIIVTKWRVHLNTRKNLLMKSASQNKLFGLKKPIQLKKPKNNLLDEIENEDSTVYSPSENNLNSIKFNSLYEDLMPGSPNFNEDDIEKSNFLRKAIFKKSKKEAKLFRSTNQSQSAGQAVNKKTPNLKQTRDQGYNSNDESCKECSFECKLTWGDYNPKTSQLYLYKTKGLRAAPETHPSISDDTKMVNFSSSSKAAIRKPDVVNIGYASPQHKFMLENQAGKSSHMLAQPVKKQAQEATKLALESGFFESRNLKLDYFMSYIWQGVIDKKSCSTTKSEVSNNYNWDSIKPYKGWSNLPSKTLADIIKEFSIEAGILQKNYLTFLLTFGKYSPKCECLSRDAKSIAKELAKKETSSLKHKYNVKVFQNMETIKTEFFDAKNRLKILNDGGGESCKSMVEDVFAKNLEERQEVLRSFQKWEELEKLGTKEGFKDPLVSDADLIEGYSCFMKVFAQTCAAEFDAFWSTLT